MFSALAGIKLLVVDGEPAVRTGLIRLCADAPDIHVVGEADTGARAIEAAALLRPDLMLLDANLPDMSGFEVLRALRRRQQRRTILLIADSQDAPRALAAGASDYLLKPVNGGCFCASIQRVRARANSRMTRAGRPLFLIGEREHRLHPLDPLDIDYVQSAGNYVIYHLAGVEYIARESIKRLEVVLSGVGFVRIERSLLLNIRAVSYAQPSGRGTFAFSLTTGMRLHSGRAYRNMLLAALPLRRCAPGRL